MTDNRPHIYPDPDGAAAACASFILDRLRAGLEQRDRVTLAVSGGNTPKLLFRHMREADFPWDKLDLFFVDERAVPATDKDSNYHLAEENLLTPLKFPASQVHRIQGEIATAEAAAQYADAIREAFHLSGGAMPVFDVIHHGMGPDGHTASLFPGDPLTADRTGIAAAVQAVKPPRDRVTLLPGVLLVARSSVFLVDGADKQDALNSVLTGPLEPEKFPSQIVARSGKHVDWFIAGLSWPEGDSNLS